VDAVTFAARTLLPHLPVTSRLATLVLHPTCSSTRMGANADLQAVAEAIAENPVVPVAWGCCGFAGDRGMLHPELTASATAPEAAEVAALVAGAPEAVFASVNRTCEIGLARATGRPYRHLLELLDEATRPGV